MNEAPRWHSLVNGTEAQVEALTSGKPLTVVSAGAGTGKTQTLAQRFAWLLASDPDCGVDQILVLTFTKKAAREMRERIRDTLAAWYKQCPQELAHLKGRIDNIEEAYISTIHSFSMKLIRESGLVLDIDPTASIMPAPKADIWWREFESMLSSASKGRITAALPPVWRRRAEELMLEPLFMDTLNNFGPKELAEAVRSCAEKLYCAGQSADTLWSDDGAALLASVDSLRDLKKDIYTLWTRDVIPAVLSSPDFTDLKKKPTKSRERLEPFIGRWRERGAEDAEGYEEFVRDLFENVLSPIPGGKIKEAINEALGVNVTEWRNEKIELMALSLPPTEEEEKINSLLRRICAVGWACWDEFRRRENTLSLADLIYHASAVLRSSAEYKRKFKHIMVDEFQDTDPLQNTLIESLWASPGEEGDFHNTLFVVGDQKQSIYRFRHADLTLFRDYIERCRGGAEEYCKYISLDRNFRTDGGLLERFNDVFGALWGAGDSSILYEALLPPDGEEAARRGAAAQKPQFELLRAVAPYGENGGGAKEAELRLRLYGELGCKIARMVEEKTPVWDKGKKDYRPASWGDFAVLVPARGEYAAIEKAFDRLGLPYILSTNKSYFARGETGDMINLVSLLAEPENALYLGGWLASPFSGVPQEETEWLLAAALSRGGGQLPLAQVVRGERPQLWARLDALRRRALLAGASSVILEVLKEPYFLENYSGLRRRRVNANIIHLAQLAEEYEKSQGKSLKGCAEYLLSEAASQGAKEEPDYADEDTDAIRVMTIHASKGLEFPVVALKYADKNKTEGGKILVSKKYGVTAKEIPAFILDGGTSGGKTVAAGWELREEKAAEAEERERLWYVGFTRAKDKLIVCSTYKEPKDPKTERTTFLSRIIKEGTFESVINVTEDAEPAAKYAGYRGKSPARELELKTVSPAKLARISASAYALISWCPASYRTVYRQGRTLSWTVKGGEGGGSDFGSLTHWLLARWDFRAESLPRWLPFNRGGELYESLMSRVPVELREEFASNAKRREIRELLLEYAKSGECSRFAELASDEGAARLFRETPFRVPDRGTVLIGATDLFWRDASGLHLRDWKSSPEEYAPSYYYERQLEFYAYALHKFFEPRGGAVPIDSAVIYLRSPEEGRAVRIYRPDDIAAVGDSIEAAAVAALSGTFNGREDRCAVCPWRGECAGR